jgi:hypothetical protein
LIISFPRKVVIGIRCHHAAIGKNPDNRALSVQHARALIKLEEPKKSVSAAAPRNVVNDYGKDLLRQHYERQHSGARTL